MNTKIEQKESRDAWILEETLKKYLFRDKPYFFQKNKQYSHIDCYFEFNGRKFGVEIKCNDTGKVYLTNIIKVEKVNYILDSTPTGVGALLFYIEGNNAFLYNLKKIDWNQVENTDIWTNRVNFDPSRGKEKQPHYFIKKEENAKKFDITNIIKRADEIYADIK